MTEEPTKSKVKVYKRYPLKNIATYNGTTIAHFILGGLGLMTGYKFILSGWGGYLIGGIYIAFAFIQMYLIMPLSVCPNCVYYKMKDGLCTSGMNVVSRKIAKQGDIKHFSKRGEGVFCHNNLYMAALFLPIILMIPALILNFSFVLLVLFLTVLGLLLFRFFVVFKKIACVHCSAKYRCPNAKAMGLVD
jgi:hypothetical protein